MSETAIIGFECPLGKYLSGKRYFDYLIDETNMALLKGKFFGQVAIVCPSLWDDPETLKKDPKALVDKISKLIDILLETKIERLTYLTGLDLITDDGDENSPIPVDETDLWQNSLARLRDFLNLQFGRVVTLRLPELVGFGDGGFGWSVLREFGAAKKAKRKIKTGLLTKHQLYPIDRIVKDIENAWECGISNANVVSEPITAFELVERLMPEITDSLPVAKEQDPMGSARTSLYSIYWNDLVASYAIDKETLIGSLKDMLK